jgi:hypothetical protein
LIDFPRMNDAKCETSSCISDLVFGCHGVTVFGVAVLDWFAQDIFFRTGDAMKSVEVSD